MIASLLATTAAKHAAAAHAASNTITVPSIRWLAILPPIIMIGGAVVLLGLSSLVSKPLRVRVAVFQRSISQMLMVCNLGPTTSRIPARKMCSRTPTLYQRWPVATRCASEPLSFVTNSIQTRM